MNDLPTGKLHYANLFDSVREELISLIVTGVLKPGQRLNEVHLAEHLGISRGPVREAARELEGQGLIVSRPRVGFFVTDFTATQIVDLYEIKIWIEQALVEDVVRYWPDALRRSTLAEIDGIDRSGKLAFSRSVFDCRRRIASHIHNRYLAEHVLSLYRKFYVVTALIDVPDEDARMDRIIGTLRDFWTSLIEGDAERARRIVADDAEHWKSDLVPYFEAEARQGR